MPSWLRPDPGQIWNNTLAAIPGALLVLIATAAVTVIWEAIEPLPRWALIPLSLLIVSLILFSANQIAGIRERSRGPRTSEPKAASSGAENWLKEVAKWDVAHLGESVVVYDQQVDLSQLHLSEPYIDFTFWLHNGAVFPIVVESNVDGHISFLGQPYNREPELTRPRGVRVPHGERTRIELRQWMFPDSARYLLEQRPSGSTFDFEFGSVNIWIHGDEQRAGPHQRQRLALRKVTCVMP